MSTARKTNLRMKSVIVAFALTMMVHKAAPLASASIVIEAVGTPNALDEPSPGDLGTIQDFTGDGTYEGVFGDTGGPFGGTGAVGIIGDAATFPATFRGVAVEFDIDSDRAGLLAANKVLLVLDATSRVGDPSGYNIEGWAYTTNATEDGDIDAADGNTAATMLAEVYDVAGIMTGDTIVFDVTDFVQADAADGANNFSGFRFVPSDTPEGGSRPDDNDWILIGEARLIVVSEPATIALSALPLGLALIPLLRRRRKLKQ